MNKREKRKFVVAVWDYLSKRIDEAFEQKDELNFDWYSDARQA